MKKMSMMALALIIGAPFAASAKKPVNLNALKQRDYQTLIATSDQTPQMTLPSKVWSLSPASVLGIVSYVDAKNKAEKARAEFGIQDPAQHIASLLGEDIGAALRLTSTYKPSGSQSSFSSMHFKLRSAKDLAASYGENALVVNVGTRNWYAAEVGEDRYRVSYMAKAQVIDTSTRSVLASKECMAPLKKPSVAPKLSAMLIDNAASLKLELREAADYCLDVFRNELFIWPAELQDARPAS